jgi:hypothetical protein
MIVTKVWFGKQYSSAILWKSSRNGGEKTVPSRIFSLDSILWRTLTGRVYSNNPPSWQSLKNNVRGAVNISSRGPSCREVSGHSKRYAGASEFLYDIR